VITLPSEFPVNSGGNILLVVIAIMNVWVLPLKPGFPRVAVP
jgi:uncharacterized membrane protein